MKTILDQFEFERIHDAFLQQAKSVGNSIAITCEENVWTYADVEKRSRAIACALIEQGVTKGERVAILAERGPELVWTVLGVLRAGAAFVILDCNYPAKRLVDLLSISAPKILVVAGGEALHEIATNLAKTTAISLFCNPDRSSELSVLSDLSCDPFNDLAYIIFTSGSTGSPKAVACNHAALVHFIKWHVTTFELTANDRFSMISGLSHDPLLRDIFTPLSIGATIAIPRQAVISEPGRLRKWMYESAVSVVHLTPPMGQVLSAGGQNLPHLPALTKMFWGGDQLLQSLLGTVSQFAPQAEHINFYGCSETPQAISFHRYQKNRDLRTVPIGKAVPGFHIAIVDADKQAVPDGDVGELAIYSRFLSLGYLRNGSIVPSRVEDKSDVSETVYYTGDRGYRLSDGDIVTTGRTDDQIKVRGFRVEVSEVSNALQGLKNVTMAVALPVKEGEKSWIDAFVAVNSSVTPVEADFAEELRKLLPSYMLPRKILFYNDRLPTLPNGKIDRTALIEHSLNQAPQGSYKVDLGNAEVDAQAEALKGRWQELFPKAHISPSSSFAELGGDSLSYVEAYLSAEEVVGTLPVGWQQKTIAELASSPNKTSRLGVSIDSFMLIRAIAIVLVVAYHLKLSPLGDGETGALFLVSGFLFGGMQLREIFNGGRTSRILVSVKNLFLPTAAFTVLASLASLWQGELPPLRLFLLGTDLVDYHRLVAQGVPVFRHVIVFWYVHALIQILLIMFGLIWILPSRFRTLDKLFGVAICWFSLFVAIKFCSPILFQPGFLFKGAPELSLAQISPIGNFATFILGILLANAVSKSQKSRLIIMAVGYTLFDGFLYGWSNAIPVLIAIALILYVPRISLPRAVAVISLSLSGASLFIYLGHLMIAFVIAKAFGAPPIVQCLAALAGGVGLHGLWEKSGTLARLARHRTHAPTRGDTLIGMSASVELQGASSE